MGIFSFKQGSQQRIKASDRKASGFAGKTRDSGGVDSVNTRVLMDKADISLEAEMQKKLSITGQIVDISESTTDSCEFSIKQNIAQCKILGANRASFWKYVDTVLNCSDW